MPFIFHHPSDFEFIETDGESTVLAFIGDTPDIPASYFASATLSPYDEGVSEYSFAISERAGDDETPYFSGLNTKNLFGNEDRAAILTVVLEITETLLVWKRPSRVHRCTNDANPPPEARAKHEAITRVFERCGFTVSQCGDWHGQLIWDAEQVACLSRQG
jgi:hypothetical protein